MAGTAGGLTCVETTSAGSKVHAIADEDATTCSATATAISLALQEFRGPPTSGSDEQGEDLDCFLSQVIYDPTDCVAAAATLNALTEAFQAGGFRDCSVSTPTTSRTTTVTTTPTTTSTTTITTSPTTTPFDSEISCVGKYSTAFLGAGTRCEYNARWLNRILDSCSLGK